MTSESQNPTADSDRARHWEDVYARKADAELSWFQEEPVVSLALIRALDPSPRDIVDIGGGQSLLAARLATDTAMPRRITVLDIAPSAIERARARSGTLGSAIDWRVGDVLTVELPSVDLWHDRAVFHFLTDPTERMQYARRAADAVRRGGHAIIATFAPSGPEKCSGLAVARSDAAGLAASFAPWFDLVGSTTEHHTTPWGRAQDFNYAVLRRV